MHHLECVTDMQPPPTCPPLPYARSVFTTADQSPTIGTSFRTPILDVQSTIRPSIVGAAPKSNSEIALRNSLAHLPAKRIKTSALAAQPLLLRRPHIKHAQNLLPPCK